MASDNPGLREPEVRAVRQVADRLVSYVQKFDSKDMERQTPCALWKVRDLVAHNISGVYGVTDSLNKIAKVEPTQGDDIHSQSQVNQQGVDAYRDRGDLLELIGPAAQGVLDAYDRVAAAGKMDTEFDFFVKLTPRTLAAVLALDLSVHFWDYGRAKGETFLPDGTILADAFPPMLERVLPKTFEKDKAGNFFCTYGIKLTDIANGEWLIRIDRGDITVARQPIARARVKIVSASHWFVLLSYGRIKPIPALLTRKIKSKGNPLLARKFDTLFAKV